MVQFFLPELFVSKPSHFLIPISIYSLGSLKPTKSRRIREADNSPGNHNQYHLQSEQSQRTLTQYKSSQIPFRMRCLHATLSRGAAANVCQRKSIRSARSSICEANLSIKQVSRIRSRPIWRETMRRISPASFRKFPSLCSISHALRIASVTSSILRSKHRWNWSPSFWNSRRLLVSIARFCRTETVIVSTQASLL